MQPLPGHDADEIDWAAFEQPGVLTTGQAVALIGRNALRGHLVAGRWRLVCRGILTMHNSTLSREQRLWAAVLVAGRDANLAGSTALIAAGVSGIRAEVLHVLIPIDRKRSLRLPAMPADMPAVRVIRARTLPEEHLQVGLPPRTTTARPAVDAAIWARSLDEAAIVLAATCQKGRATTDEIFEVLAVRRGVRRLRMIRRTMLDIAGGAQALSEIDFVDLCRRFRLPPPDRRVRRVDAAGRARYLDACGKRWRPHAEIDGAHHMRRSTGLTTWIGRTTCGSKGTGSCASRRA